MPNALLTIRDLKKSYLISAPSFRKSIGSRSKQALAGVSLTLGPGLYGLLGPNGAGKSTLISIITDTLAADSGEVLWCGKPARGIRFRRVLGYMPQQQGLYDSYTGRRFLAYMAALKELPRKSVPAEVDRVAAAVNLSSELDKRLSAYSGGMKQRVVIAIALSCDPDLLICDEPTTALDVTIQAKILELIRSIQKERGISVIYITHDLGVVANIADRVAVMYAGDIVEIGTSDEIYYDPRHPYTWALLSSMPQMGVKGEDLFNIQGTPPNLFTEIHGDAFAPRNPLALKIDFVKRPPYFDVSTTHRAKTWLLDPRAPKIEPPAAVRMLQEEGK